MSNAKRFAEMTDAELWQWWMGGAGMEGPQRIRGFAALRDAIRAEAMEEVLNKDNAVLRDLEAAIHTYRTRAERAEQERDEQAESATRAREQRNISDRERDALKDEVAGFEAMWEQREKAHDAALGEARREVAEECFREYDDAMSHTEGFRRLKAVRDKYAELASAPATPSGEGVTACTRCGYAMTDARERVNGVHVRCPDVTTPSGVLTWHCRTCQQGGTGLSNCERKDCKATTNRATPQPEPEVDYFIVPVALSFDANGVPKDQQGWARFTAKDARRLVAMGQEGR